LRYVDVFALLIFKFDKKLLLLLAGNSEKKLHKLLTGNLQASAQ